jgi:hypothetical protein
MESEALGSKFDVGVLFKHNADQDYGENNFETESEGKSGLRVKVFMAQ